MRGLCYFFLSALTQVSSSTFRVFGHYGDNVTLPCMYEKAYGLLQFCWGRGTVPMSGCSDTVLSSQGGAVVFRQSSRFQLLGRTTDGDTSLTIFNAQRGDTGVFGCRVEIPGWFNDLKVNVELILTEAPEEPQDEDWTTASPQDVLTTSTPRNEEFGDTTFYFIEAASKEEKFKSFFDVGNVGRMASIFLCTIILILFFIFRKRFLRRKKLRRRHPSAAENIYESVPALM